VSQSRSRNARRPPRRGIAAHLTEAAGEAGRAPDVWPGLAARLAEESPAPRRFRGRVWVVGVIVAALIAFNPVAYLVPRCQEAVDAMVRQEPAAAALRGALMADPGLFGLWSAGAFQPIQASATVDSVTLTILGTYFDRQVTVIAFAVSGPNHSAPQSLAQLWSPATSNVDAVSWASAGTASGVVQTTALQQYPIYLSDQWGIPHPVQNWSYNAATGEGAFTFAGYPGWLRRSGLRLVLHVGAMEEVTAPQGPFGPKTLRYATGPWDVAFTALPPREPALDTSPDVTVTGSGGRITLSTIRNAPSGSWMTVSSEGAPLLTGLAVQWVVESPDGRKVEPLGWQGSPHGVLVQWPPLTTPGVYRLQLTTGGHTWTLLWQQPAWDASLHWAQPSTPAPLYQGTSWADAARLLGIPALPPPAGLQVQSIQVEDTTEPLRHPTALPRQVQMTVNTAMGPVQVTESPAWLTVLPPAATLTQFVASLKEGTPPGSLRTLQIHGIPAQLWTMPSGPDNRLVPILYLYPSWGSILIAPAEAAARVSPTAGGRLIAIAEALTAAP
jgi:hypothetical protein